ncbi:LysR substrate-binding domain-containing protein [Streptomyces sp. NPDC058611]|uniref:LysR substrate-binding domain-containing protein n=1 Tax=unclassified Streptomyces TaxID=2593676 RepID=UPI0036642FD4
MTVRACQAAGFTPRVRHRVDEFATVPAPVAAGQGVAVVPQLGVAAPPDPAVRLNRLSVERRTRVAFRGVPGGGRLHRRAAGVRTAGPGRFARRAVRRLPPGGAPVYVRTAAE